MPALYVDVFAISSAAASSPWLLDFSTCTAPTEPFLCTNTLTVTAPVPTTGEVAVPCLTIFGGV